MAVTFQPQPFTEGFQNGVQAGMQSNELQARSDLGYWQHTMQMQNEMARQKSADIMQAITAMNRGKYGEYQPVQMRVQVTDPADPKKKLSINVSDPQYNPMNALNQYYVEEENKNRNLYAYTPEGEPVRVPNQLSWNQFYNNDNPASYPYDNPKTRINHLQYYAKAIKDLQDQWRGTYGIELTNEKAYELIKGGE